MPKVQEVFEPSVDGRHGCRIYSTGDSFYASAVDGLGLLGHGETLLGKAHLLSLKPNVVGPVAIHAADWDDDGELRDIF